MFYRRNSDSRRRTLERLLRAGDQSVWPELKALYARTGQQLCECKAPHDCHIIPEPEWGECPRCGGQGGEHDYEGSRMAWYPCYSCNATGRAKQVGDCPIPVSFWDNAALLVNNRIVCMQCAPKDPQYHKDVNWGVSDRVLEMYGIEEGMEPVAPGCMCSICYPDPRRQAEEIQYWEDIEEQAREEVGEIQDYTPEEIAEILEEEPYDDDVPF